MTINVEHVGQKQDLYVNDTKECDNMYSNTELNEKISKYRIAVNDLALVVEMKKKSTDFKDEFSVRIIYYSLTIFNQITKYFSNYLGPINLHSNLL